MNRMLTLTLIALIAVALFAPSANAGVIKNAAKNIGRAALCPLKAVARATEATIDTVTFKEPLAILSVPKAVRQEAVDVVESVGRAVTNTEPIAIDDVGAVNTAITDADLDWLADGVVYGVTTGVVVHNGNSSGAVHHVGKAAFTAAGMAVGADLAPKLTK